ncbi:DUF2855 family protein [Pseudomarimonas arenosa]|uniref:DUF2855 family protein n=1 Tax=Pseudomarimonas arenosa TaxID=2774145 RepID=A0AAW3ZQH3_9GAMM|nr:DUF2855 family protein [Pseudomarimonas arenosa]MBD8526536.1 DUF2855 family protein [Pseudomarimonas arenosa]
MNEEQSQRWQATVARGNWHALRRVETLDTPMRPGLIELQLEQFALTANNVTYALLGESYRYWDFFPAAPGEAIVPVWGAAKVVASTADLVAVDSRFYGFFPMATHCRLQPGEITGGGFVDAQLHRRELAAVYNRYERLPADAGKDESLNCVFKPLLVTAAMLAERLRNALPAKGGRVVMTSASSKTAMLSAFCVRQLFADAVPLIGITSPSRVARLSQSGLFDQVFCYQDIDHVGAGQAASDALLDFAGAGQWLEQLHDQLAVSLLLSLRIGKADWQSESGKPARGPAPETFFAPREVELFFAKHGAAAYRQRMMMLWSRFLSQADRLCQVREAHGFDPLSQLWQRLIAGQVDDQEAWVVRP